MNLLKASFRKRRKNGRPQKARSLDDETILLSSSRSTSANANLGSSFRAGYEEFHQCFKSLSSSYRSTSGVKASFVKKRKNVRPQKTRSLDDETILLSSSNIVNANLGSSLRAGYEEIHHLGSSLRAGYEELHQCFKSLSASCRSTSSVGGPDDELECLKSLSAFCRENNHEISRALMFRIAHFHNFNFERSKLAVIKCPDNKYLNLRMEGNLEKHFAKGIIFPIPDLKAKDKSNIVYFRPSRYSGKRKNPQLMVESLCYVLNDLSRTQSQCREGITMVVHMKNWARDNFDQEMWVKTIRILQGDMVPTKVKKVLFVDVPEEFQKVWDLLEQLMPSSFYKKVHVVQQSKLNVFLNHGYDEYLPNDLKRGLLCADEMTEDYIDQKRYDDENMHRGLLIDCSAKTIYV